MNGEVAELLVNVVLLTLSAWEDLVRVLLGDLAEMTPVLGVTGHRALKHMRAR